MRKTLIIIGAGGHGKVCLDVAKSMKKWREIYLVDDNNVGEVINEHMIITNLSGVVNYKDEADVFVAIGNNELRKSILEELINRGYRIANLIHPSVIMGSSIIIGVGTVLMPGVIINASTNIGKGTIINTGVNVDHDCTVNNYVHLSPGTTICGSVIVNDNCWIGSSVTVINNVNITSKCVIGAGSLILSDINVSGTYVGNPLRRIK